jgi:predicted RNase H-like HicB family nuclease
MNMRLLLEKDEGSGRWSAVFPELPGCASAGDTEGEAIANAKEALSLWFEPTDLEVPQNAKIVEVALR